MSDEMITPEATDALLRLAGLRLRPERRAALVERLRHSLPQVTRLTAAIARIPHVQPVLAPRPDDPGSARARSASTPSAAGPIGVTGPAGQTRPVATDGATALHELTVAQAAAAVRAGQVSPVELVQAALDRIEAVEPSVRAFVTVLGEQALLDAREAEAREPTGPLHGVPIAVKDTMDVAGVPTTAGSRLLRDAVAADDATAVARLRSAGAILLGKTSLDEFSRGGSTRNPLTGATHNPWDLARIPGGSSGGSAAAVAAGMSPGTLGADTGGSIRLPAAMNGITGLRPTQGLVSNYGTVPLTWTMDTIGPMARTAEDCGLLLGAIAGADPLDPSCVPFLPSGWSGPRQGRASNPASVPGIGGLVRWGDPDAPLAGLRVGVLDLVACEPAVASAVHRALEMIESLGASTEQAAPQHLEDRGWALLVVERCEPSAIHQAWLRERADEYGEAARAKLEEGEVYLATQYLQAQRYRALVRAELVRLLDHVDVLACPTVPFVAPTDIAAPVKLTDGRTVSAQEIVLACTGPASLAGLPALSVPCGFSPDGLPVGLQLIGRPFDEAVLLGVAAAYQLATTWHAQIASCRGSPASR